MSSFNGDKFTLCEVDASTETLRLFLTDPDTGRPFGSFDNVSGHLEQSDQSLLFAMNAGMYHSDRSPVGHYVENGRQISPVISTDGPGNFGLLPNGVFCVGSGRAYVMETKRFQRENPSLAAMPANPARCW